LPQTGARCSERTTGLIRTSIKFLKELHRRFGRIAIIMDNTPQHTGTKVKRYIKDNPDIRAITLSVATLELNATGEYWHQLKQNVMASTHYADANVMRNAICEFIRTCRHTLDITVYLQKIIVVENNMICGIDTCGGMILLQYTLFEPSLFHNLFFKIIFLPGYPNLGIVMKQTI